MSYAKIADLSVDELKTLIKDTVAQTLTEILGSADKALELQEKVADKLPGEPAAYSLRGTGSANRKKMRETLAEQFKAASEKSRDESLKVCREFEAIDQLPS